MSLFEWAGRVTMIMVVAVLSLALYGLLLCLPFWLVWNYALIQAVPAAQLAPISLAQALGLSVLIRMTRPWSCNKNGKT